MPVKLLTSGGGGVNLVPSSSIASDQTMYLPTSGTSGGTVLCTDSTGGTANGVLYLNGSKQVTSGSGLVFDSSGNLLVGTTSGSGQSDRIYSSGAVGITATTPQINFYGSGTTIEFVNRNTGGSKTFSWYYQASGVGSPATLSTSGVWTNASDSRGKENITDIGYGLNTVMEIQARQYDVKSDQSHAIGFIAQELLPIVPEVVHVTRTDESGNDWYGIDYGSISAVLVKAIQEQQAIIESLTQRIEALEYTKQGE